jgi:hypothetical protein
MKDLAKCTWLFALTATVFLGCMAEPADDDADESDQVNAASQALCPAGTFNVGAPGGSEICVPNGSRIYSNPGAFGCPAGAVITPAGNVVCLPGTPGPIVIPRCPAGTVWNRATNTCVPAP